MKALSKNLLPKKVSERDALNQLLSKISLRFPKGFSRLTIIITLLIFFSGYHPSLSFPPVKLSKTTALEQQEQKVEVQADSFPKPVILPHPGYISTRFSSYHPGVDIATGLSMPIHPINPGTVTQVGKDFFGLGNFVIVTHPNGFSSKYAHMGKVYVKGGQLVEEENLLGEVGLTGNTSGPHTHLEVTYRGNYIDPQTILPTLSEMPKN